MKLQLQLLHFVVTAAFYNAALAEVVGYVAFNDSSMCVVYEAMPAYYGPRLPAEGLTGYLTRVIPANACSPIENPPASRTSSKTYIALIQNSDCSFVKKVLHAQEAGYQAALVYSVDSEQLVAVMSDNKEIQQLIKIPSFFTGRSVSLHLQRALQCKEEENIRLLPPKRYLSLCEDNAKKLQETSTTQDFRDLFYVVVATVSVVVGLSWYAKACKLKLHMYKQGDEYESCVICMVEYKEGDCLKILPCSHAYHSDCIDSWFYTQPRKKTCPFCKQVVNTYGQGDLLPDQAGEDGNEEEEDHEDHAFREGHEGEYVEEDKGDSSIAEEEEFGPLENGIFAVTRINYH